MLALNRLFNRNEEARAFAQAIAETIREPLLVLDENFCVLAASRSFYQTFKVDHGDTDGKLLFALGDGQWDIPGLRVLLEKIIPERGVIEDYEVSHDFPGIGRRTMLLNARQFHYQGGPDASILLGIEDVTATRALQREKAELLAQKQDLVAQKTMLAKEFDHRLLNSLQLISSLLSLQSRAAKNSDAAAQLSIAGSRVAALGRVHRRLQVMDHLETVDFKQYLMRLCQDLSGMLFQDVSVQSIVVEGEDMEIPTLLGIPLGFIVNELVTNSVKHSSGTIRIRLMSRTGGYALSVSDEGPGLIDGFTPAGHKGLGMKIVQSLVNQIGGELQTGHGENGRGARFTVLFTVKPPAERPVHAAGILG